MKGETMNIPDSKFEIGDNIGLIGCGRERRGIVLQKAYIIKRGLSHWVYFLAPLYGDKIIEGQEADYEKIQEKEKP